MVRVVALQRLSAISTVARLAFPALLRDVPAEVLQQSAAEESLPGKALDNTKKGSKIFGWLGSK